MELPITRPSQMSYADEINFSELLGELKSKRFNGFVRVTSGSSEGYILFNEGIQSASSFDNYSKIEAIEKIKSAVEDSRTLIEVFDLKKSQMNYLMDLNKFFIIDSGSKVENIIDELKKTENAKTETNKAPSTTVNNVEENKIVQEVIEAENKSESVLEEKENKDNIVKEKLKAISEAPKESSANKKDLEEVVAEPELSSTSNLKKSEKIRSTAVETIIKKEDSEPEIEKPQYPEENEFIEPGFEAESVNREDLMKKYGLKDVGEEEVDNILETYKGGSLSDEDVEKIELTLMNKIKKTILGIPKIRGTEVMVFLDNTSELSGTINIITEYESKGFFSRIRGQSKDLENLKRQIMNITQMEVKKSFRGYPEIVDDFEINVEIS